jgi:hypothetical protein
MAANSGAYVGIYDEEGVKYYVRIIVFSRVEPENSVFFPARVKPVRNVLQN